MGLEASDMCESFLPVLASSAQLAYILILQIAFSFSHGAWKYMLVTLHIRLTTTSWDMALNYSANLN